MFIVMRDARLAGVGAASSVGDFGGGDGGVDGGDNAAAEVGVVSGARAGERENGVGDDSLGRKVSNAG